MNSKFNVPRALSTSRILYNMLKKTEKDFLPGPVVTTQGAMFLNLKRANLG